MLAIQESDMAEKSTDVKLGDLMRSKGKPKGKSKGFAKNYSEAKRACGK